jgi:hypothetical protein
MTDRDQFAAAALTGLLSKEDAAEPKNLAAWWPEYVCRRSYEWADAMLRERNGAVSARETVPGGISITIDTQRERLAHPNNDAAMGTGDTPQTHATPSDGSARGECTLTGAEREAIQWFSHYGLPEHRAATLRGLLKRLA